MGIFAVVVFNANLRAVTAGDTFAARYLPFSILHNHSLLLNPILDIVAQGRRASPVQGKGGTAYWIAKGTGDNYVPLSPIVVPIVVAPLYYPAVAYLDQRGWDPYLFDQLARMMEKFCASLIAATSVALLYLLLRRRAAPGTAALLSLVYAFGTNTWVISSQALWAHGLAQLLIVATLLLITGRRSVPRVAMAGLFCAMIAANRQPDVVLAAALGLYGLWWAGRLFPVMIIAGLPPIVFTVAYNLVAVGHLAGAYAVLANPSHYSGNVLEGIAGLLVSPTRGLFIFSPFLLFVPLLIRRTFKDAGSRSLALLILLAIVAQVVGYGFIDWRQGISWGPRWLTDMLPLLMWLLPPIVTSLSRPGRILFGAACALAIAIQTVGAFWYTGATDTAILTARQDDRMRPMWDIRNAAFLAELQHPPAPRDLFRAVQGNIDLIEVIDVIAPDGAAGDRIERFIDVAGWALADGRTPVDLALLVDGREVAGTSGFFIRPDVVQALGVPGPAGWRLRFPAHSFEPGEHSLAAMVRTDTGAEARLLRRRSFIIPADSPAAQQARLLARAADLAERRLAEHQQPGGYWLTAFTTGRAFEHPRPELNTYLNAIMLDVAGPAATTPRMQEMLARARAYLTSQIEADGLVRYHGRPNAPNIGTLGCAITPDADDTALVWRVAPGPDRDLLARAMASLRQFQRPDGLYRTWLAERSRYACLDPGRDPNPADIGIQMHILLLLAEEDRPAADALCQALAPRADDDDLWVYYADAPPVAILRLTDLARAGCALQLPPSRLQTHIPGQARWAQAAQQLRQLQNGPPTTALHAEISGLLRELAARDFAQFTTTPPLLYHNDLTASVQRYYWSEDVGYLLWLRLYQEQQRIGRQLGCSGDDAALECGDQ